MTNHDYMHMWTNVFTSVISISAGFGFRVYLGLLYGLF